MIGQVFKSRSNAVSTLAVADRWSRENCPLRTGLNLIDPPPKKKERKGNYPVCAAAQNSAHRMPTDLVVCKASKVGDRTAGCAKFSKVPWGISEWHEK
ncbi:3323_t:CDS:2, partial [Acaulospora morrowiae]